MNILRRIYRLLLPAERKQALTMAASTSATALLDLLGLAALLPVLYFLLGRGGQDRAALLFSLLAVAVIVVKCLLTTLLTRYQNQCLLSFYRRLSFSLFSSYYRRGLLFVRERGSTQLGHEVNAMCYAFSHSLVAPICRIASDVLLIVLVTVALLVWDGLSVLILFASFVPFMCVYFFSIRPLELLLRQVLRGRHSFYRDRRQGQRGHQGGSRIWYARCRSSRNPYRRRTEGRYEGSLFL